MTLSKNHKIILILIVVAILFFVLRKKKTSTQSGSKTNESNTGANATSQKATVENIPCNLIGYNENDLYSIVTIDTGKKVDQVVVMLFGNRDEIVQRFNHDQRADKMEFAFKKIQGGKLLIASKFDDGSLNIQWYRVDYGEASPVDGNNMGIDTSWDNLSEYSKSI